MDFVFTTTQASNDFVFDSSNDTFTDVTFQGGTYAAGIQGLPGEGVPAGGTTNQALVKTNATDYNTQWQTVDKSFVGLGNVDNTSDADKPVSTAQQTAIDAKVSKAGSTMTGTLYGTAVYLNNRITVSPESTSALFSQFMGASIFATPVTSQVNAGLQVVHASNTATGDRPIVGAVRGRGTLASPLAVQSGDEMFSFFGAGYDGSGLIYPAEIKFVVDDTVSTGVIPTKIGIYTGSNTATRSERLTIRSSGLVGIGTTSPDKLLHLYGSSNTVPVVLKLQNAYGGANGSSRILLGTATSSTDNIGALINANRTDASAGGDTDLTFSTSAGTTMNDRMIIKSTGNVGIGTTAPTHTLTLPSTATGIALYNTADQTTNYERLRIYNSSNIFYIDSTVGGTGTIRPISFSVGGSTVQLNTLGSTVGMLNIGGTVSPANSIISRVGGTYTATSGVQYGLSIASTINQSSTAGYTALLINPTETTTGSGAKLLIDAQVGGVSKFSISNTGKITTALAQTYTTSNVTTDRTYDANATTLDELADIVGTLIADLKAVGVVN